MKYAIITLISAIITMIGVNVGLEMGLSAKPTIDISQCQLLTRYEDGSFDCDPDGVEQNTNTSMSLGTFEGYQPATNTTQVTADGALLQPAITEVR